MTPDEEAALAVARQLIAAGVPLFAARPDLDDDGQWRADGGHSGCGYWLPPRWERTVATLNWLDPAAPGFQRKAWRPGYALCMLTGCGFDGLDVDPRNGGTDSRAELVAEGVWPTVLGLASTPSGGTHELVRSLGVRSLDGLRPGLDVKAGDADGQGRGFVFVAPTIKLSKVTGELGVYRWVEPPDVAALGRPDGSGARFAVLVRPPRRDRVTAPAGSASPGEVYAALPPELRGRVDRYVTAALAGVRQELADAASWPVEYRQLITGPDGEQRKRGWERLCADAAWRLGRLARAQWNELTLDDAREAFLAAAPTDSGWTREALEDKWDTQRDRGEPAPWPAALDEPAPDVVADYVASLEGAASGPPATGEADSLDERFPALDWQELFSTARAEPEWLCEPLLEAGRVVALYSPAKTGKSLLSLEISAALAAGRPVLGNPPRPPVTVLYVDQENSRDDLLERLRDLRYGPDELARLRYLSFTDLPPLDTAAGGLHLHALAQRHSARLVVLDTVSRVIGGEEDKADTFRGLYRHTVMPLKAAGVAVLRLDHSGKDLTRGQRGSSGKADDVDAVWSLVRRTPDTFDLRRTHSRTNHGQDHLALRRRLDPLRHDTGRDTDQPSEVDEVVRLLAVLSVPLDAGRPRCREALKAAGLTATNAALEQAVRRRKELPVAARAVAGSSDSDVEQPTARPLPVHAHGQSTGSSGSGPPAPSAELPAPVPLRDGQVRRSPAQAVS